MKGYRSASLLILVCDDIIVLSYVAIIAILKSVTVVLVESIDFSCCFLLFYALDLGDLCLQVSRCQSKVKRRIKEANTKIFGAK